MEPTRAAKISSQIKTREFGLSRKRALGLFVVCGLFLLNFALCLIHSQSTASSFPGVDGFAWARGFEWVGTIFFGVGMAVSIWQLLDRRPVLTMNQEGMSFGMGRRAKWIPWSAVRSMRTVRVRRSLFVSLKLYQIERYFPGPRSFMLQRYGLEADEFPIPVQVIGVSPENFMKLVDEYRHFSSSAE